MYVYVVAYFNNNDKCPTVFLFDNKDTAIWCYKMCIRLHQHVSIAYKKIRTERGMDDE